MGLLELTVSNDGICSCWDEKNEAVEGRPVLGCFLGPVRLQYAHLRKVEVEEDRGGRGGWMSGQVETTGGRGLEVVIMAGGYVTVCVYTCSVCDIGYMFTKDTSSYSKTWKEDTCMSSEQQASKKYCCCWLEETCTCTSIAVKVEMDGF